MKTINMTLRWFFIFVFLLISGTSVLLQAQSTTFGVQQIIQENTLYYPTDVHTADLDNDGDIDILSNSEYDDKIVWYANNGNGTLGAQQVISTLEDGVYSIHTADLDNDGDVDVLSASGTTGIVSWYENIGNGNFGVQQTIATASGGCHAVHAADLDNDGDIDVMFNAITQYARIAWVQNDGNGNFGVQQTISSQLVTPWRIFPADLDNDNDIDVLSTALSGNIAWHENNGDGTFAQQQIIATVSEPRSVYATDLDGDADMDVLATATANNKIMWYENVGNGSFTAEQIVSTEVNKPKESLPVDLDSDNDIDVLSISSMDGKIAWYENDGSANFGTQQIIANMAEGGYTNYDAALDAADLDNDGNIDIAAVFSSNLWAYKNNGNNSFEAKELVTSIDYTKVVLASDLDNDGNKDVIICSMSDDKIAWYKNEGLGNFSTMQTISILANDPNDIIAVDLDNDGDIDIASASKQDNEIAWYENDGNGNFAIQQVITTSMLEPKIIQASDLDNDGDMDILSSANENTQIAWLENDGTGNFATLQIVGNSTHSTDIDVADLDNDGDIDVVSVSPSDNKIAWYQNDGTGNFSNQNTVTTISDNLYYAYSIMVADLDNDNDMDILSASFGNNTISWYENDGIGNFGTQQLITTMAMGVTKIYASDLNNDGNIDILSASQGDSKIAWYANDGIGNFGEQQLISVSSPATAVYADDLDNDGDADVLSAHIVEQKIVWHKNQLNTPTTFFTSPTVVASDNADLIDLKAGDLNGDGLNDIVVISKTTSTVFANNNNTFTLQWYANNGSQVYTNAQTIGVKTYTYSNGGGQEYSYNPTATAQIIDYNLDGHVDVLLHQRILLSHLGYLGLNFNDNIVTLYTNDGTGNFSETFTQNITAESLKIADLNNNNLNDFIRLEAKFNYTEPPIQYNKYYKVSHYLSTSNTAFPSTEVSIIDSIQAQDIKTADLNGDGFTDFALQLGNSVVWYANNGDATFASPQTIVNISAPFSFSDVDNNGTIDLVLKQINNTTETLLWYSNNNGTFGNSNTIASQNTNIDSFEIIDFDLDGDNDALLMVNNVVYWSENSNNTFAPPTLTLIAETADIFAVADMNGDIDADILLLNTVTDSILQYNNNAMGINSIDIALNSNSLPDTLYVLMPQSTTWQITNNSNTNIPYSTGTLIAGLYLINSPSTSYTPIFVTPQIDELPPLTAAQTIDFESLFYLPNIVYPPTTTTSPIQIGDYLLCLEWISNDLQDSNPTNNRICQTVHIAHGDVYQVSNATASSQSNGIINYHANLAMTTQQYYLPYSVQLSTDAIPSPDDILLHIGTNFFYDNPYDGSVDLQITLPANTIAGDYYLIVQYGAIAVENTGTVIESNYDNNITVSTISVSNSIETDIAINYTNSSTDANHVFVYGILFNNSNIPNTLNAYFSVDSLLSPDDILLNITNNTQFPLEDIAKDLTLPVETPNGSYYIIWVADPNNIIDEVNEANNIIAIPFDYETTQIPTDFAVQLLNNSISIIEGTSLGVNLHITNQGAELGILSTISFEISNNDTGLTETFIYNLTNEVQPGQVLPLLYVIEEVANYPQGAYQLIITVQALSPDYDLTNNTINTNFVIQNAPGENAPNLQPELYYLPQYASPGQTMGIPYRIKNSRPYPADASRARLYFSSDYTLSLTEDILIAELDVPALAALQTYDNTHIATIPSNYSASHIIVFMVVDADEQVQEANEIDNINVGVMQIEGDATGVIDLMLDNVVIPTTATPAQNITTSVRVWNLGNINAPISTIKYYLSQDIFASSDDIFLGEKTIPGIAANTKTTFLQSLIMPTNIPATGYFLVAHVDKDGIITEVNENNNSGYKPITLIDQPDPDNFADLELLLTANPSPTLNDYSFVTYTLQVRNVGNITTNAVEIAFAKPEDLAYVSDTTYHTTNFIYADYNYWFGTLSISELPPNESVTVELNLYNVNSTEPIVCFAQVTEADTPDFDSTPNNNNSSIPTEDDEAIVTLNAQGGNIGGKDTNNPTIVYPVHLNTLWPNPAKDHIYLNMYSTQERDLIFRIYNTSGHLIAEHIRHVTQNINDLQFEVSNLPKGMYLIRSEWNEQPIRFVKY